MKAAVYERYGPPEAVVRIAEVERPVPGDDQLLVRVRAASVNPMDVHPMRGKPAIARLAFGLRRPKMTRPGVDVAGIVEAVGRNVTRFTPGDAVFGACRGSMAEYACADEARLAAKPAALSFEQAAALPVAGLTALQALRDKGGVGPGRRVLVVGAGGGIGTFAVQIARALGAEATAVCSTGKVELVRSLGADPAIDYTQEDCTRGDARYDVILDLAGSRSFGTWRRVLAPNGILLPAGLAGGGGAPRTGWLLRCVVRQLFGFLRSRFTTQKLVFVMAKVDAEDLAELARLVAAGQVAPVIDRRYRLEDAAAAIAYFARGHASGKVVIAMDTET